MQQTEQQRRREDWTDDTYVADWLNRQAPRVDERVGTFNIMRSILPHRTDEAFRYLNVGGGDGWLDEVILSRFSRAHTTVHDGSPLMLERAQERLKRFGDRVQVVHGNFGTPEWTAAAQEKGPYDLAVSTIAIHNLREPSRIRVLYAEIFGLLSDGGAFFNLDYVRAAHPSLRNLSRLAAADPDAQFVGRANTGTNTAGTVEEQLVWLREAGFSPVDCFWKEFGTVLIGGFRGPFSIPEPA
ncbi:MAG: tRNA (cmo5U34)-methyltransferase [Chloroflexota bacterium]|jgi:tRNA (cmo5U34)-methyltransferase|nr:tRNA (cmo5U34)-methyltransferase [Chloroflexota bacterium]